MPTSEPSRWLSLEDQVLPSIEVGWEAWLIQMLYWWCLRQIKLDTLHIYLAWSLLVQYHKDQCSRCTSFCQVQHTNHPIQCQNILFVVGQQDLKSLNNFHLYLYYWNLKYLPVKVPFLFSPQSSPFGGGLMSSLKFIFSARADITWYSHPP